MLDIPFFDILKCQESTIGRHGRFFIGSVDWLYCQTTVRRIRLFHTFILSIGTKSKSCKPIDLVTYSESLYVFAYRLDLSCQYQSYYRLSWSCQTYVKAHRNEKLDGYLGDSDEDVTCSYSCCMYLDENFIILWSWFFYFS